jgi:hypothetical protein
MFKLAGVLEEPKSAKTAKDFECSVCCEKGMFSVASVKRYDRRIGW